MRMKVNNQARTTTHYARLRLFDVQKDYAYLGTKRKAKGGIRATLIAHED